MNKLVIIGNGFDLAHGLKTRYSDFLLWYLKKIFKERHSEKPRLAFISVKKGYFEESRANEKPVDEILTIEEFLHYCEYKCLEIGYNYKLIESLIKICVSTWVDIENEYFNKLLFQLDYYLKSNISVVNNTEMGNIIDLNNALDVIKVELSEYLNSLSTPVSNGSIQNILYRLAEKNRDDNSETLFLNFNYTSIIQLYKNVFPEELNVIHIHGKLDDDKNPIIFGYGDESNDYFEKIEKMNNNELTRHLKSFAYLQTDNYRRLFEFLDKGNFEVYVMGHSLGLSDRLLFNHIFEHEKFNKVQLYFYEYQNEKGEIVNDFFQKTQELSRHFKLNSKHKMRTKVVPFNESKPLTIYKP